MYYKRDINKIENKVERSYEGKTLKELKYTWSFYKFKVVTKLFFKNEYKIITTQFDVFLIKTKFKFI